MLEMTQFVETIYFSHRCYRVTLSGQLPRVWLSNTGTGLECSDVTEINIMVTLLSRLFLLILCFVLGCWVCLLFLHCQCVVCVCGGEGVAGGKRGGGRNRLIL